MPQSNKDNSHNSNILLGFLVSAGVKKQLRHFVLNHRNPLANNLMCCLR